MLTVSFPLLFLFWRPVTPNTCTECMMVEEGQCTGILNRKLSRQPQLRSQLSSLEVLHHYFGISLQSGLVDRPPLPSQP